MNRHILTSLFTLLLVTSCTSGGNTPTNKEYFPKEELNNFLLYKGVDNYHIPFSLEKKDALLSYQILEDNECDYFSIQIKDSDQSIYNSYYSTVSSLQYDMSGDIYVDPLELVGLELYHENEITNLDFYSYNDLVEIPPEEEEGGQTISTDFPLQNAEYIGKNTNLSGYSESFGEFTFSFISGGSSYNPASEKSNDVILYASNQLSISSTYEMSEIVFTRYEGKIRDGDLTSNNGTINKEGRLTTWNGNSKSVTFTATAQYRFENIKITYFKPEDPIIGPINDISGVLATAETLSPTIPSNGWYLSNVTVNLNVKAIDAIDSVTTASGLDPKARGKVLCVDNTGYIICSSGVSTNNPIDFYQRVKNYIKAGTTTYTLSGKIAFFNGVVEVKVESYKYDETLDINPDLNSFASSTVNSYDDFLNDCKSIKTNADGYGVKDIVRLNGLTYFNKYNSAGSYYFLDQESKLVPVYSLLDKDRSSLIEGKVYDIIGFTSLYKGRPSLRILKVIENTEVEPRSYDFSGATEVTDIKHFYKVNPDNTSYKDEYFSSAYQVYKMDVYVSRYAYDKYTFNTSYYYDSSSKEYTTGTSQTNAANRYSLGIFNKDLTYRQILLDFLLENCESASDCEDNKITLYFTLACLDTADGKKMWRVNIFEDLTFGIDYYYSSKQTIELNSSSSSWTHDSAKQTFSSGNLVVTNASSDAASYAYDPTYLKIQDGTSLKIEFNKPILGFTLYHGTYSRIAGFGSLTFRAYRQFSDYTEVLLTVPSISVVIDDLAVTSTGNTDYLRVDSLRVNYLEA